MKEERDAGIEECFEPPEGPLLGGEEKKECRYEEANMKGTGKRTKRRRIGGRRKEKKREESVKE